MVSRYVLDSCALLAYMQDEPGADAVEGVLLDDQAKLFISTINLGEVLYVTERRFGRGTADYCTEALLQSPNLTVVEATWQRVQAAARIKARGGLALGDCFCAALAQELDATVVTTDPEFRRLEAGGLVRVVWIPPAADNRR